MTGHGDKLSRKMEAAVAALLSEATLEGAAAKAEVGARTLRRWLKLPAFQSAYAGARQELLARSVALLLAATGHAVDTLRAALDAGRTADQVRAAVAILTQAHRGVEVLDLEARLSALEQQHRLRRKPK
jgi:hypothetical protein